MKPCRATDPDLTDDGTRQRTAWAWQIPFAGDPVTDAAIKKTFPCTPTGRRIAHVAPDRLFFGGPYD